METLFAWAQLSDIHIGHGGASHVEDQRLVLDALRADVARLCAAALVPQPDVALVTGDIAFSGNLLSNTEYDRAAEQLRAIGGAAGVGPDQIFVVPGNHDVQRSADKDHNVSRLLKDLREGRTDLDEALRHDDDRALLTTRLANYLTFAAKFAPACRTDSERPGAQLYWRHRLTGRGGLTVRLVGLNTALLAADEHTFGPDKGKLRLGKAQLADVLLNPPLAEGEAVIVLTHHPFGGGWLFDERDAGDWARRLGHVHTMGHVHEAESEEARSGAGGSIVRVVAGAAHGERETSGASARHGYNFAAIVLVDGCLKLRVWLRRWSERNREFRRDGDALPEGQDFAEHDIPRLCLPGSPPPDPAPREPPKPPPENTPEARAMPSNIEPVGFLAENRTGDYYDGKHARPGHILEGLDVRRPLWLKAIADVFQRESCCVIRASSGQGKSSLLYRYAYEQRAAFTILRLHRCSTDAEVDASVNYLRGLDRPVLVLVDNLGYGTRLWGQAVARLAGTKTLFLVSSREEDWHRYPPPLATISYGTVAPFLDLKEAQQIYDELKRRGRCRAAVPSATWAYEKVAARRLLIEFIYLITHGQMLRERLEDQIRQVHERGEERAKLDVLRLVATAQVYGSAVPLDALEKEVRFDGDPGLVLRSLEGEYLVIEHGNAEGLHLVRSEHLVPLLHDPIPTRAATVTRLTRILDQNNLASFVSGLVADASVTPEAYMDALAARCRQERPALAVRLAEAVFAACEQRYIELHRPLYEAAIQIDGKSATYFVSMETMPRGSRNSLKDLPVMSAERKEFFETVLAQFKEREACGSHEVLRLYGERVIGSLDPASYTLSEVARLSYWGRYAGVEVPWVKRLMSGSKWEEVLFASDRDTVGAFLWEVSRQLPARFDTFLRKHRQRLLARYQVEYEVAVIAEDGDAIEIRFVPDPLEGYRTWNNQAVTRLEVLRRWLPRYEKYRSEGIFTEAEGAALDGPPTDKNISPEHFDIPYDDAPQNRVYLDLVNATFSVASIDEWKRQWFVFRRSVLAAVEQLRGAYIDHYRERIVRPADLVQPDKVLNAIRHLPDLPPDWKKRCPGCHKAMSDFWGGVHGLFNNAIMLLLPSLDGGSSDRRALVRTNAFNLLGCVPVMQREFAAVAKVAGGDGDLAELERKEIRVYEELMELAEFDCDQKGVPVRNLPAAITRWRTESRTAFQARIKDTFRPLVDAGLTMYFPEMSVREDYGTSLVVAFEVFGFAPMALATPLDAIVTLCARAGLELNYLYIVPCVEHQRAVNRALRISRMGLEDVAQDKTPEYGLLPTDDPPGMDEVLPAISRTGPPDLTWFWKIIPLIGQLAELRKSFRLLRNNLHDEGSGSQLLAHRQRVTDEAIAEVYKKYGELRKETDAVGAPLRQPELWGEFVASIDGLFAFLRRTALIDVDDDDFMGMLQDFDERYGRYASAQYDRWEGAS
ncbi:MAG: metallophosphoesterase [Polyangiales bacterium]